MKISGAKLQTSIIFILLGILLAAFFRIIPHYPNFTPIGAVALFSGAFLANRKWAFVLPIGAMLLSDFILELMWPGIGFHNQMPFVYASFFAILLIGTLLHNRTSVLKIAGASVAGSVIFFLLSNFGVWLGSIYYAQNIGGLFQCFAMAVPFYNTSVADMLLVNTTVPTFANTIYSDLLFNTLLFGAYFVYSRSRSLVAIKA